MLVSGVIFARRAKIRPLCLGKWGGILLIKVVLFFCYGHQSPIHLQDGRKWKYSLYGFIICIFPDQLSMEILRGENGFINLSGNAHLIFPWTIKRAKTDIQSTLGLVEKLVTLKLSTKLKESTKLKVPIFGYKAKTVHCR